jgi:heptosyltransferase-2
MPDTLIVRLPNWLGDTVMAVPALRALRAARPDARVALVGPWATLLAGQGLADVLVPYARAWAARLSRWDELRALHADAAVLLPNSFEAALAAWYWRAKRRVGYDTGGRGPLLTDRIAMPEPREHQADEYARVVARLGVDVGDRVPRLQAPDDEADERAEIRALLAEAGVRDGDGARVGVHLGAAYGPSKRWPVERVAELCRTLSARGDVAVVLGTAGDREAAERIARETAAPTLVGRDRPELLPALLSELDALVCGDTGVGHLAAALGTPVVALFGPTDPRLSAPRGAVRVLAHPVPCAPCFYRACPIEHPCLDGLSAATVAGALTSLSSSTPGSPRRDEGRGAWGARG